METARTIQPSRRVDALDPVRTVRNSKLKRRDAREGSVFPGSVGPLDEGPLRSCRIERPGVVLDTIQGTVPVT